MDSLRRKEGCSLRLCLPSYTGCPRLVFERGICENSRFQSRGLSDSHNKLAQAVSERDMHTLLATTPLIEILSFLGLVPDTPGQNRLPVKCACVFKPYLDSLPSESDRRGFVVRFRHHTLLRRKSLGTRRRKNHSAVTIVPWLFTFSFLVPLTPVES